jgi:hypothetical protein
MAECGSRPGAAVANGWSGTPVDDSSGWSGAPAESSPKWSGAPVDQSSSSVAGSALRGAAQSVVPAAGAIAGGQLGAELGSVGGLPGAIVGGLAGGLAGSYLGAKGQEAVIGPPGPQTQTDIQQHPYARFAGGFLPYAAALQPGGGLKQAAVGAAIGGGLEAGQQAAGEEKFDPTKIAISAGAGALLNKPTRLGRAIDVAHWSGKPVAEAPAKVAEEPVAPVTPEKALEKAPKTVQEPIPEKKWSGEPVDTEGEFVGKPSEFYDPMARVHREMSEGQKTVFSKPSKRGPAVDKPYTPVAEQPGYVPTKERNLAKRDKREPGAKSLGAAKYDYEIDYPNMTPRQRIEARTKELQNSEADRKLYEMGLKDGAKLGNQKLLQTSIPGDMEEYKRGYAEARAKRDKREPGIKSLGAAGAEEDKGPLKFKPLKESEDELHKAFTTRPQERLTNIRKGFEVLPEEVRQNKISPEHFEKYIQPIYDRIEELGPKAEKMRQEMDIKEEEWKDFLNSQEDQDLASVLPYAPGKGKLTALPKEAKNEWVKQRFRLDRIERALDQFSVLDQLKRDYMGKAGQKGYMTTETWGIPETWKKRKTKMPGFEGISMDPSLRAMLDNVAPKDHGDILNGLMRANRIMINTLFYNPFVHGLNELAGAYAANGWRNFNVLRYPETYKNWQKAAVETSASGPLYQEMLREGASLRYSRITDFDLASKLDDNNLVKDPNFKQMAKHAGLDPKKLYDAYMETVNRHLWKFSDNLRVHRVLELKERGMNTAKAVDQMERELVNYRVPTEAYFEGEAGRMASAVLRDSTFNVFGRYHYGNAKVLGNMIRDLKGTKEERMEAAGKIVSLAVLTGAIYPILMDPLVRLISGQQDTRARRPGLTGIPQIGIDAVLGKGVDWNAVARSAGWEDSPVDKFILFGLANLDWKGHHVVTPAASTARKIGQGVGFVTDSAIAPLAQANKYLKSPDAFRAFIADAIIGEGKEPKEGGNAAYYGKREAKGRLKHPDSVIEGWVNQMVGE